MIATAKRVSGSAVLRPPTKRSSALKPGRAVSMSHKEPTEGEAKKTREKRLRGWLYPRIGEPDVLERSIVKGALETVGENQSDSLQYLHEEIRVKLDYGLKCGDLLDMKSGAAIALIGTLMAILAAFTVRGASCLFKSFSTFAIVLLVAAAFYALLSFKSRTFEQAPKPDLLVKQAAGKSVDALKKRVIEDWVYNMATNREIVKYKARCLDMALFCLSGAILALGIGIVAGYWAK